MPLEKVQSRCGSEVFVEKTKSKRGFYGHNKRKITPQETGKWGGANSGPIVHELIKERKTLAEESA